MLSILNIEVLTCLRLSAMMLGRLRMDVALALQQYAVVGRLVFARRRLITGRGLLHARFKNHLMEWALQSITARFRSQEDRPTVRPSDSDGLNVDHDHHGAERRIDSDSKRVIKRKANEVRLHNKNVDASRV